MAYLATIRYQPGETVTVRLRDGTGDYWDFTAGAWVSADTASCRQALTQEDSDGTSARYSATITLPAVSSPTILEYMDGAIYIGEDDLAAWGAAPAVATAPLLVSLAQVRAHPSISANVGDNDLTFLIQAASTFIQSEIGYSVWAHDVASESHGFYDFRTPFVVPDDYPVESVASLTIGDTTLDPSTYALHNGIIYVRGPAFGPVTVSYRAGYEQPPADLQRAALELVVLARSDDNHTGQSSEAYGGQSVSWLPSIIPAKVKAVLDHYRRPF